MKIYTKTGDKGQTSLFDGTRVVKNNIRVETYGTVDELNSVLGIVVSYLPQIKIKEELILIQSDLFEIGAVLANPKEKLSEEFKKKLSKRVLSFEEFIDEMTSELPELMNFILPGGGNAGSFLQFARAVSRRAERRVVELSQKESVDQAVIIYFNRFSDLLFTMGRYVNFIEDKKEIVWLKENDTKKAAFPPS